MRYKLASLTIYTGDEYSKVHHVGAYPSKGYVIETMSETPKHVKYVAYLLHEAIDEKDALMQFKSKNDLEDWVKELIEFHKL